MAQTEMFEGGDGEAGEGASAAPKGAKEKTPLKVSMVDGERGRGNKLKQGWFQTDRAAADFMWRVGAKNPQALPLLMYLVAHLERGSGGVIVSAQTAAADLGVSGRTIQNTIAILKRCNFVQVLKSGNTNLYVINSQVAWMGVRGNRYATFNATIRVAEAEQDRPVDELIEENKQLQPIPQFFGAGDLNWDVIDMDPQERQQLMGQMAAAGATAQVVEGDGVPDAEGLLVFPNPLAPPQAPGGSTQ